MTDCFPPVPLYIVTGIVAAMFTAVTSKIGDGDKPPHKGEVRFAWFVAACLAVPFLELLTLSILTLYRQRCGGHPMDDYAFWVVLIHTVGIIPLLSGAAYWLWFRNHAVVSRLGYQPPTS